MPAPPAVPQWLEDQEAAGAAARDCRP